MEQIKIVKGDILNLKNNADVIILRSKKVVDLTFDKSKYTNSSYCIAIPDMEFNEDNVLDYLEYYKRAIKKIKEMRLKTVAIEAIELRNEDMTFALAVEFAQVIKDAIGLTIGIAPINVALVCKDRDVGDIYELAIYGEIRSSQMTMIDQLEQDDVILIPTTRKILKFDKNYKLLKKVEPKRVFWKCYTNLRLDPGRYFLVEGERFGKYYYFMNLLKDKKMKVDKFADLALAGVKNTLEAANLMGCKSVIIPIVRFIKNKTENEKFVKEFIDVIAEFAEECDMNVKFYCPDADLWDVVVGHFEKAEK